MQVRHLLLHGSSCTLAEECIETAEVAHRKVDRGGAPSRARAGRVGFFQRASQGDKLSHTSYPNQS